MTRHRHKTLVFRSLQLLLAALMIYTIADPSARELHALMLRLFFRIPGEHTVVLGELPHRPIYVVPNVEYTYEHLHWLLDRASSSPEAYLLATHSVSAHPEYPPVASWRNHPYAGWAACKLAANAARTARSSLQYASIDIAFLAHATNAASTTRNRLQYVSTDLALLAQAQQQIADALTVVHYAQKSEPTNGALWLAEAALDFARDQRDSGLAALRSAAARPNWDYGVEAQRRAIALVRAEGIPRLDALSNLWTVGTPIELRICADTMLRGLMRDAINRNDDVRLAELFALKRDLQRVDCRLPEVRNDLRRLPSLRRRSDPLLDAMARRLGITIPDDESAPLTERIALTNGVVREFLHTHLPPQLATELLQANAQEKSMLDKGSYASAYFAGAKASIVGMLSLLLVAFLATGLLLELPFILQPRSFLLAKVSLKTHRWKFWAVLILVTAGATFALFTSFYTFVRPVGLRCGPDNAWLTPFQEALFYAAALSVLLAALRVMIEGSRPLSTLYAGGLWLTGIAYFAAIALGGLAREQAVRTIFTTVLGMTPA